MNYCTGYIRLKYMPTCLCVVGGQNFKWIIHSTFVSTPHLNNTKDCLLYMHSNGGKNLLWPPKQKLLTCFYERSCDKEFTIFLPLDGSHSSSATSSGCTAEWEAWRKSVSLTPQTDQAWQVWGSTYLRERERGSQESSLADLPTNITFPDLHPATSNKRPDGGLAGNEVAWGCGICGLRVVQMSRET